MLKPLLQDFASRYAGTESPTRGNGRASWQASHPRAGPGSASVNSTRALKRPEIQTAVGEILAREGFDLSERMASLAETAKGGVTRTTVQRSLRKNDDGSVGMQTVGETVSEPTFADRLQAQHIIAKLTGDYEKPKIAGDLARAEYKRLARKVMKAAKDADTKE